MRYRYFFCFLFYFYFGVVNATPLEPTEEEIVEIAENAQKQFKFRNNCLFFDKGIFTECFKENREEFYSKILKDRFIAIERDLMSSLRIDVVRLSSGDYREGRAPISIIYRIPENKEERFKEYVEVYQEHKYGQYLLKPDEEVSVEKLICFVLFFGENGFLCYQSPVISCSDIKKTMTYHRYGNRVKICSDFRGGFEIQVTKRTIVEDNKTDFLINAEDKTSESQGVLCGQELPESLCYAIARIDASMVCDVCNTNIREFAAPCLHAFCKSCLEKMIDAKKCKSCEDDPIDIKCAAYNSKGWRKDRIEKNDYVASEFHYFIDDNKAKCGLWYAINQGLYLKPCEVNEDQIEEWYVHIRKYHSSIRRGRHSRRVVIIGMDGVGAVRGEVAPVFLIRARQGTRWAGGGRLVREALEPMARGVINTGDSAAGDGISSANALGAAAVSSDTLTLPPATEEIVKTSDDDSLKAGIDAAASDDKPASSMGAQGGIGEESELAISSSAAGGLEPRAVIEKDKLWKSAPVGKSKNNSNDNTDTIIMRADREKLKKSILRKKKGSQNTADNDPDSSSSTE